MRVGVIPDIHGNKNFEIKVKSLQEANVDKIVFLGDYFDSHDPDDSFLVQRKCFNQVLELKNSNPDFYTVLLGNHDIHYLTRLGAASASNKQWEHVTEIQELLLQNRQKFDAVFVADNWIFSHAGVTSNWKKHWFDNKTLSDINKKLQTSKNISCFNWQGLDPYGDDPINSCVWVRPPSLIEKGLTAYNQCVGHTVLDSDELRQYWYLKSRITNRREFLENSKLASFLKDQFTENPIYVFLDSSVQDMYGIIDTESSSVQIYQLLEGEVKLCQSNI